MRVPHPVAVLWRQGGGYKRNAYCLSLFLPCHGLQYFLRPRHPSPCIPNLPVWPNQIHRPIHHATVRVVEFGHLLSVIDQQREREVVSFAKLAMALRALRIDAIDGDILPARIGPDLTKLAEL